MKTRQSKLAYDLERPQRRVKLRNHINSKVAELGDAWKDNQRGILPKLLKLNQSLRSTEWPYPFNNTTHLIRQGDARNLEWIPSRSVHLIVTSPPYWTLKQYETRAGQLGEIDLYENFLDELDKAWAECARVLVPGGRICCVVGDVCVPRKREGRHYVMPLHADIQVRMRKIGLDCLTPILWFKIANGVTEAKGNGAGFYGKPYQPGAIIKNDLHRKSNLGDSVAVEFYEDLVTLGKSTKLPPRIAAHDRVINLRNTTIGKTARRGDGTSASKQGEREIARSCRHVHRRVLFC